jgi:hypothetical protein
VAVTLISGGTSKTINIVGVISGKRTSNEKQCVKHCCDCSQEVEVEVYLLGSYNDFLDAYFENIDISEESHNSYERPEECFSM